MPHINPNVTVANNRAEFKSAFNAFKMDFQKTKLKTCVPTSPLSVVGLYAQPQSKIESLPSSEVSTEVQLQKQSKNFVGSWRV